MARKSLFLMQLSVIKTLPGRFPVQAFSPGYTNVQDMFDASKTLINQTYIYTRIDQAIKQKKLTVARWSDKNTAPLMRAYFEKTEVKINLTFNVFSPEENYVNTPFDVQIDNAFISDFKENQSIQDSMYDVVYFSFPNSGIVWLSSYDLNDSTN